MDDVRARIAQFVAAQRAGYAATLPARVAAAESLWRQALEGEATADRLEELERIGHTLYGTAGTYGLHETGQAGAELEAAVAAARTHLPPGPAQRRAVEEALAALRRSVSA